MYPVHKLVAIQQHSIFRFTNSQWSEYDLELYLGYYFKKGDGEIIHDKLRNFKNRRPLDFRQWEGIVIEQLDVLLKKELLPPIDVVIRCLGSSETRYTEGVPLSRLADSIAEKFNCKNSKSLIFKSRPTKKFAFLATREERENEIDGVYQINLGVEDLNDKVVVVIDDVRTAGITSTAIAQKIREHFRPKLLILLTLTRTDSRMDEREATNNRLALNLSRF